MARSTHFTTTTAAVAATRLPSASVFLGIIATSAEAASGLFVKLWWEGTGTAPPTTAGGSQPATAAPIVGTTVPHLTIPIPTVTGLAFNLAEPLNNGGNIWYWVTGAAADNSTAVLATGGDVITLVYD